MNREQVNKLLQARGHACVEATELFQMLADESLLLWSLFQNTLRHNIGSSFLCDDELSKTVADMLQSVGNKAETRIVENLLLHTKYDTQFGLRAHLAQRTEEFEVKNDFSFVTGRKVGKELIDDNQISLVRILF